MKLEIKTDNGPLVISDEGMNTHNFVNLYMQAEDQNEALGVDLDELVSAVLAFENKRSMFTNRDSLL